MKYIFYTHDHKFRKKNTLVYSEGKFSNKVFDIFDIFNAQIFVFSRIVNVECSKELNVVDKKNLIFSPVKGVGFAKVFTLYLMQNLCIIFSLFKKSDFLVVRLPSFLGVFVLILNMVFRKKYFIEFVGDPLDALLTSQKNPKWYFRVFASMFAALNRYFIKNADGVIYVTQDYLQSKYPTLHLQAGVSDVEIEDADYDFNPEINSNQVKIALIGSFNNEYKGIDTAIKAIHELKKYNNNINLHILGSGSLKEKYLALADQFDVLKHIHFDGSRSGGKEVANWLKDKDIYIQPSRTEGLPRALVEAMSVGLPAIASNVGGIPELLDDQFLIDSEDYLELARKVQILLASNSLYKDESQKNYIKAKQYTYNALQQKRLDFWLKAKNIIDLEH